VSAKSKTNWKPRYKGEVNIGFVITGNYFSAIYKYTDSNDTMLAYSYPSKMETVLSRPLIETVHGVEIGPYFFVGAGVGLQYYCGKLKDFQPEADYAAIVKGKEKATTRWNAFMLPLFADLKFKYPVSKDWEPFLNFGVGGSFGLSSSMNWKSEVGDERVKHRVAGGFYCDLGGGVRYKILTASVGLQHQDLGLVNKYKRKKFTSKEREMLKSDAFYIKVGVAF
jgi:hypothetical protein